MKRTFGDKIFDTTTSALVAEWNGDFDQGDVWVLYRGAYGYFTVNEARGLLYPISTLEAHDKVATKISVFTADIMIPLDEAN